MLTKRIIPCLDIKDARVVKGVKFLDLKDAGDPVETARIYDKQQADELVFLDITASFEKRKTLIELVDKIAQNIYMPFTVGGGIRNIADIRDLLNAGADKVSINTIAVNNPNLIRDAASKFGSQCIVVAIDAKKSYRVNQLCGYPVEKMIDEKGINNNQTAKPANLQIEWWQVVINGGRTMTNLDALEWAQSCAKLGAGEILLTSMDYDGTKEGFDLELTRKITDAVNIPVIASGGAGKLEHFYDCITKAGADACLAASIFHYQEFSVRQVKEYLAQRGVPVRL